MTDGRFFLWEGEDVSRMDRNNLKVCDQQEVQRRASLSQQQPSRKSTSGIKGRSSAPFMVFNDEGAQPETFRSLTSQPERSPEVGTPQDFCSGSYNPQTPQHSQKNTQTEIQAQAEVTSLIRSQDQTYFNTPLLTQAEAPANSSQSQEGREKTCLEEKEDSDKPHSRETEPRIHQSLSKPTASVDTSFREKRVRLQEEENKPEAAGNVHKDEVKGRSEFTAPHGKMAATSEGRWERSLQHNNTHVTHANAVHESSSVQHVSVTPPLRDNRVSPRAWRNQEVIVSFKTVNDHMERVSSFDMETQSTGCDETKTHFHLCQCGKPRPGSSTGSHRVEGQKQATTTAAFCLCVSNRTSQASTPLKRSAVPMHSTTVSAGANGASSEDEDNPSSQCHHFPKLPSPPPHLHRQRSHLNLSGEDSARQAGEGWMFPGIQKLKQDHSLGSGLGPLQQSFSSSKFRHDRTHVGNFNIFNIHSGVVLIYIFFIFYFI